MSYPCRRGYPAVGGNSKVSAADGINGRHRPSPGWRKFLVSHPRETWAGDFFCLQTIFLQTIHVFFVVDHASQEVVHVRTTRHPTSEWTGRQIVEACGWDRQPPRCLIHHRDSRYRTIFYRRIYSLGIASIRCVVGWPSASPPSTIGATPIDRATCSWRGGIDRAV